LDFIFPVFESGQFFSNNSDHCFRTFCVDTCCGVQWIYAFVNVINGTEYRLAPRAAVRHTRYTVHSTTTMVRADVNIPCAFYNVIALLCVYVVRCSSCSYSTTRSQWHRHRTIRPTVDVGQTRPIILNNAKFIQVVSVPPITPTSGNHRANFDFVCFYRPIRLTWVSSNRNFHNVRATVEERRSLWDRVGMLHITIGDIAFGILQYMMKSWFSRSRVPEKFVIPFEELVKHDVWWNSPCVSLFTKTSSAWNFSAF